MSTETLTMQSTKVNGNTSLPSEWYRSPALYELERRAIFSKEWLLTTHKCRFQKPGDYHKFEIAGFPFFLIMDRQHKINGFHNVCRHRGYPVIKPEAPTCGTKSILACYYHGWSYGLNGKLAKAPKFDGVEDFEKEKNGLFPIHVRIDARGIIWVNLEASEVPSIPWEMRLQGSDRRSRLAIFNMDDYVYDHSWSIQGNYNWKAAADNYNECYHCPTTHPGFVETSNLDKYRFEAEGAELQYFMEDLPGKTSRDFTPSWFYPNGALNIAAPFWYLLRSCPTSATTVHNEYEVYRHKDATDAEFEEMDKFFKQVEGEDKELCNAVQVNLNLGSYSTGHLQPDSESGVLCFQQLVREAVTAHRKLEKQAGKEVWPTRPLTASAGESDDIKFCQDVERCAALQESGKW
ncbi:hypothetical protein A1O7_08138 [Cladophialophora yegresii CBS 114405]|uniref:Choline monooxygenase, chloroplastic n=1 Tax=Cladophialophora yegresii CBS 114405 TaxID=1182544 RepID=W9VHT6_9EURO|nr:uncharacterized protein A1O7_08138 [Cladophialophora yegresii CBS 114405]EXJ55212.1 hypothetical protein A1O7_08138 [Cladophialophora yegresii CBS 114405]